MSEAFVDLDKELEAIERKLIADALQRTGGNKTAAAKLLNIPFRSMRYRLEKYGMK